MKEIDTSNLKIHYFTHPGVFLLDELKIRGIKQKDLANSIGIQKTNLNEIIKGKRDINADLAILLELVLGVSALFWMHAQVNYDIAKAKNKLINKINNNKAHGTEN
jgi:HTH-type transcriptional regulator/antitoxin HigA